MKVQDLMLLTADCRGIPEDLGDVLVHLDGHVLILYHLIVPLIDLLIAPVFEGVSGNRVHDVGDVGSWQLHQFLLILWEGL